MKQYRDCFAEFTLSYMRFFAEFILSGDSSVTSLLQNDINEGLRMTRGALNDSGEGLLQDDKGEGLPQNDK